MLMYTVKVEDDNTLNKTIIEKLYKNDANYIRTNNGFHVLVKENYDTPFGTMDMMNFSATMVYLFPSAKSDDEYKTVILRRNDEPYKKDYVEFLMPTKNDFLSEVGFIRYKIRFIWASGNTVYLRETRPTYAEVESTDISDHLKVVSTDDYGDNTTDNFGSIGGLKKDGEKVYIVDKNGNAIGAGINIDKFSTTTATNLKIIEI